MDLGAYKLLVNLGVLATLWTLEGVLPQFTGRSRRVGHDVRNVALGLINAGVMALALAGLIVAAATWASREGFGLLRLLEMPAWASWPAAIILFDLWMYLWHVANHRFRLLWRFHAVHHADAEVDTTSAVRFHTGEIVLSGLARLAVVPLLGMRAEQVVAYELLLKPIILFHHANLRVPERLDRVLRWLIVTPRMHWVHHSRWRPETDSNYGSIFSFWDRLAGTFRFRRRFDALTLGLDGYGPDEWFTLSGMLLAPFRRRRLPDRSGRRS